MSQLYLITVPGLQVNCDWAAVHDRLLDDFPRVIDVLATTMPATLLIIYEGDTDIDAWLDGLSDAILGRRIRAARAATRNATHPTPRAQADVHARREGIVPSGVLVTTSCSRPGEPAA